MTPAQPPLPTACNLRFQPEVGSQNSTLISESLEGFSVAVTRQNSGRSLYGLRAPPFFWPCPAPGATNSPAGTTWAIVIVVSGNASDVRLSHEAANAGAAARHRRIHFIFFPLPGCRLVSTRRASECAGP